MRRARRKNRTASKATWGKRNELTKTKGITGHIYIRGGKTDTGGRNEWETRGSECSLFLMWECSCSHAHEHWFQNETGNKSQILKLTKQNKTCGHDNE